MRRFIRAVAATAAASFAFGAPVSAGAAEDAGVVRAKAPPGSALDSSGSFYLLDLEPGQAINQTIVVGNATDEPVDAHVEPVDGFTKDATGAGYSQPGEAPTVAGAWVVVETPVVTLQPGEERSVPFTVRVPEGTQPGEYLAGVSAYVPAPDSTVPTVPGAAALDIKLQPRRVIAVQVNVPGPKSPVLAVTGARPVATANGIALLLSMENQGNAFATGEATVRIPSTDLVQDFEIDTFVSNTDIEYRVPWTDDVRAGRHDVSVQLRYGDDQRVNWNGTVDINAALARELESELDQLDVAGGGIPVLLLVGVGLGVTALLAFAATRLRRRRRAPQPLVAG